MTEYLLNVWWGFTHPGISLRDAIHGWCRRARGYLKHDE